MENKKLNIHYALSGILLSTLSNAALAENTNPFVAKALPQGYMLLAENTLPEPPPPPDKAVSTVTNAEMQNKAAIKTPTKQLLDAKSAKAQDGGCGAGSCAAKLNKAKVKNVAK